MLTPDFLEAERFLYLIDPVAKEFTFQTIFSDKSDYKASTLLTNVMHGTFDELKIKLGAANNYGAGVFVMINQGDGIIHGDAKTCRTTANVKRVRALFVDLDGAPLEPAVNFKAAPSLIVHTSPIKFHVYWLTNKCPLEQFKPVQQSLAIQLNGDQMVCDLPRVMRLPGFYHTKGEPFLVKLIKPRQKEK